MGKKILLVVDYQNDFVTGSLGFDGADKLDEGIAAKVRNYAKEGYKIYYTLDTHTEDYLKTREGIQLPVEHCIAGTEGWKVYGETAKALEEVKAQAVEKTTFGMYPDSVINRFPISGEVEEVELVGVVTNMCVLSNAVLMQAKYPDAQIVIDASLCDSFDRSMHESALSVAEGMQMKVINRN